mgnify:CR=1 FL=1
MDIIKILSLRGGGNMGEKSTLDGTLPTRIAPGGGAFAHIDSIIFQSPTFARGGGVGVDID